MTNVVRIPTTKKSSPRSARPTLVRQFLIVLQETDPLVWRRIQVPARYTFWDLHVAIQDAMGWQDCHLHEFRLVDATESVIASIGLPSDEDDPADRPTLPGWTIPLATFFDRRALHSPPAVYAYDFGDDWRHTLIDEGLQPTTPGASYPRCLAGGGRCPPEDCGGVDGYASLLDTLGNPRHPEHKAMLEWAGGPIDPQAFDPSAMTFDNPKRRWKQAFGGK